MATHYVVAAFSLFFISGCSYCEDIHCKTIVKQLSVKSGANVTLPCAFNSTDRSNFTLVWQIEPNRPVLITNRTKVAILDKSFSRRVGLPREWYRSGNAELQISRLRKTDAGNYSCILRGEGPAEFCARLEVKVTSAGHSQSYGLSCVWMSVLLLAWSRFSF